MLTRLCDDCFEDLQEMQGPTEQKSIATFGGKCAVCGNAFPVGQSANAVAISGDMLEDLRDDFGDVP